MSEQLPLPGTGHTPPLRGRNVEHAEETVAAWAAAGHLTGAEHSATREALLTLARLADLAELVAHDGSGSPLSATRAADLYLGRVLELGPAVVASDALDDALEQLVAEHDREAAARAHAPE